jgi:hypothetical protein
MATFEAASRSFAHFFPSDSPRLPLSQLMASVRFLRVFFFIAE